MMYNIITIYTYKFMTLKTSIYYISDKIVKTLFEIKEL